MRPSIRNALIAFTMLGALGCEHGIDGSGSVLVSEEVQGLFSAERPGQVVFRVERAGQAEGPGEVVGYLCGPGTPSALRFNYFTFDCAQEETVTVHVWAAPAAKAVPPAQCGQRDHSQAADPAAKLEDAVAYGRAEASVGVWDSVGACNDGSFRVDLTLEPVGTGGRID
jgi:hypothetical protein